MAKLTVKEICALAKSIIGENPGGIRYSTIVDLILKQHPETPEGTVRTQVSNLGTSYPGEITKPSRGLYKPAADGNGTENPPPDQAGPNDRRLCEADFYEPFADWLKNDLDEVTEVSALGGAGLRTKWGTPDVVGIYKPLASNLIKFPLEIVAGEVKLDPQAPVVAFGQAVATPFNMSFFPVA